MTIDHQLKQWQEEPEKLSGSIAAIGAVTRTMGRAIDTARAEREKIAADRRFTPEYARTLRERVDIAERQAVIDGLTTLWNHADGSAWRVQREAEAALTEAREAASESAEDATRLSLEYQRVGSKLSEFDDLDSFDRWYDSDATRLQKLALADTALDRIKNQFPGDSRRGSVLEKLKRDRTELRLTDDVRLARAQHDASYTVLSDAWEVSTQVAKEISDGTWASEAQQILSGVDARMTFADPSDWSASATFELSKRAPAVEVSEEATRAFSQLFEQPAE